MPQIFVILSTERAKNLYCPGESLDAYFHRLIPIVEKYFGIQERNTVSLDVMEARRTTNETDIQLEVRYTAGTKVDGTEGIFDPSVAVQKALIEAIGEEFKTTAEYTTAAPRLMISVWCKPYYNSVYKWFNW
jgi:hypothetical protein